MNLRFSTAGESHGAGCLAVLEGLPKGLRLDLDFINAQLARRQRGYGRSGRQRIEKDRVEILGGWREGRTLEAPLILWIVNRDHSIEDRPQLSRPRPGHADLAGCLRHGDKDIRANLERASARETVARVAAGAVAQILLAELRCSVLGHVVGLAGVRVPRELAANLRSVEELAAARARVEASPVGCLDSSCEKAMMQAIDEVRASGDSLGGMIEIVAVNVPGGLGSFSQWDQRLDGRLGQALLSIPAIKACEIGTGFEDVYARGSAVHDPIMKDENGRLYRASNHAGGIEAGISNAENLLLRAAMKPIATLRKPLASVDLATGQPALASYERADVCALPAAATVAEAMVALVLAQACLELFSGGSLGAFLAAFAEHERRQQRVLEPGP